MNYLSGLIKLIFGIGAIIIGIFAIHLYFVGDEKALQIKEKLKIEGHITFAKVDTTVLEMKIRGITTYTLGYKFNVDGKEYKGQYSFGNYNELDSLTPLVTYLPSDPKINSLNINGELSQAKKEVADNNSSSLELWVGIGLILLGFFNLFRAYLRFRGNETPKRSSTSPPPLPSPSSPPT